MHAHTYSWISIVTTTTKATLNENTRRIFYASNTKRVHMLQKSHILGQKDLLNCVCMVEHIVSMLLLDCGCERWGRWGQPNRNTAHKSSTNQRQKSSAQEKRKKWIPFSTYSMLDILFFVRCQFLVQQWNFLLCFFLRFRFNNNSARKRKDG